MQEQNDMRSANEFEMFMKVLQINTDSDEGDLRFKRELAKQNFAYKYDVDMMAMEDIAGAISIRADVRDAQTRTLIRAALESPADVVLSDMAAPASGHAATDRLRVIGLCETALELAEDVLAPGGAFICKSLGSGADAGLLAAVKRVFTRVKHVKPPASRSDSAEIYLVATGFRGSGAKSGENPD